MKERKRRQKRKNEQKREEETEEKAVHKAEEFHLPQNEQKVEGKALLYESCHLDN